MLAQLSWSYIIKHIMKYVVVFPRSSVCDLCSYKPQKNPSGGWLTASLHENSWHWIRM